jgi:hypothetical protein
MAETETASPLTPAYLPWKTFTNTLAALAQNMPNRIDRSAFPGQSGATQNQLLVAFKFFGLIHDDGRPTEALLAVAVADEAAQKNALRKLIEQKYARLIALNLMKTTPAEFAETMSAAYNVTGDTRLKATRFFLNAAAYLGIAVSPLLLRDRTKTIGNGTVTRKRRVPRPRLEEQGDDDGDEDEEDRPESPAAESRSVQLRSGGTLTLAATTKFMSLSSADRNFVFGLIDKLEEYEKANPAATDDSERD